MKKLAVVLTIALLSGAALAVPETYVIDPTHTAPRFEYSHFGFSNQVHRFDKTSGRIILDRKAKTASVDVSIDAKSVNTGYAVFNEHIQGENFFYTERYPSITFKSTKVMFEGDKPVAMDGDLTIKGVTRPITLKINSFLAMPHPIMKRDAIGANAETSIKRSDFNMGKYAPNVSDEVKLSISMEAFKE